MNTKFFFRSTISFCAAVIIGLVSGVGFIDTAPGIALSFDRSVATSQLPKLEATTYNKLPQLTASSQLNNLLYNKTIRSTSFVRLFSVPAQTYWAAYYVGWDEYNRIIDKNTLSPAVNSPTAGWLYIANLIGGGRGSYRQFSSSRPIMPTIEIFEHYTPPLNGQSFSQVKEIKFPYLDQNSCPVASTSSC